MVLQNLSLAGKHKLADRWKATPYLIVVLLGDLRVYKVRPEERSGPDKIVHQNLLLPVRKLVSPTPTVPRLKSGTPEKRDSRRARSSKAGHQTFMHR